MSTRGNASHVHGWGGIKRVTDGKRPGKNAYISGKKKIGLVEMVGQILHLLGRGAGNGAMRLAILGRITNNQKSP